MTSVEAHTISVVVPVYLGEQTLPGLLSELATYVGGFMTPAGHPARIAEVLLVFDNGPDGSPRVMRELAERYEFVRPVWLTRNFGQHAATLAGMASSGGDWIVTMDEDGQHNPAELGSLLDAALGDNAHLVYGKPVNPPPHSAARTAASRTAKHLIAMIFSDRRTSLDFQSYRLVLGEIGRGVAAYAGSGVYLDIALGWITTRVTTAPITLRQETRERSGYSYRSLVAHFLRMVITSGTRSLRLVAGLGVLTAAIGVALAIYFTVAQLLGSRFPPGWTTLIVLILLSVGVILASLGVVAEYLGVAVNMAMGKPPYMIMSDPEKGPLGRESTGR